MHKALYINHGVHRPVLMICSTCTTLHVTLTKHFLPRGAHPHLVLQTFRHRKAFLVWLWLFWDLWSCQSSLGLVVGMVVHLNRKYKAKKKSVLIIVCINLVQIYTLTKQQLLHELMATELHANQIFVVNLSYKIRNLCNMISF